ncbi:MAG: PHP domain-containing protein, partial [Bacteroidia bacterium]|nr:PHP domain-containing protein [Bacteroidia bacterium]
MYFNCHTAFSFKYGTLTIERLFQEAQRYGIKKLALTDINNTAAYVEMLRHCAEYAPAHPGSQTTKYGKPAYSLDIALGVEFRNENELRFIALAKNGDGFTEINRFLSFHNRHNKAIPMRAPEFQDVFVIYPFGKIFPEQLRSNEYIGIRKSQLTQFSFSTLRKEFPGKFLAWHPVTFATKTDFNVHRLLRAIDNNTLLSKLPTHQQAQPDECMTPAEALEAQFADCPDLVERANFILDNCSHS